MERLNELIDDFIKLNPLYFGLIAMIIGIVLLIFRLEKNNSFKMKDFSYFSWKVLIESWVLIILLFLLGFYLILKSF